MTTNLTGAAVEAGARAILAGADIGSFYASGDWEAAGADVQMSMYKAAADALTAALPILHPTIPNTVEALEQLPDGAILRAELGSGAISATRDGDKWGTAGSGWLHTSDELARHYSRITEWTVLWPLGGAA